MCCCMLCTNSILNLGTLVPPFYEKTLIFPVSEPTPLTDTSAKENQKKNNSTNEVWQVCSDPHGYKSELLC